MKKQSKDILGYFELDNGDRIEIMGEATGRNMMNALQFGQTDEVAIGSHQICQLTRLNGHPLTIEQLNDLEVAVVQAIKDVIVPEAKFEERDISEFPKTYQLNNKKITLLESRKQKHDTEAFKYAGKGNNHEIPFWIIHQLIQIDDEAVLFDTLLEMPASEVSYLLGLIAPGKPPKFVFHKS